MAKESTLNRDELIGEIIRNARRDRLRLEAVADGLANGLARLPKPEEPETDKFDPEIAAAFAEEIAKISEALTKSNQQLVELVKIAKKEEPAAEIPAKPGQLTPSEIADAYDEIQPQEVN